VAIIPWYKLLSGLIGSFLALGCVTPTNAQASPSALCYAFLGGNDHQAIGLYTHCEGKDELVIKSRNVWDFAVAADGSVLALRRQRGAVKGEDGYGRPTDIPHYEIEVVSLKPGFQRHWSRLDADASVFELHPYCGTILAIGRQVYLNSGPSQATYKTDNVLTGQPLSFPPYVAFGCSADGKTLVGFLDSDRQALWTGLPPRRKIAEAGQDSIVFPYDISPDGQYVAYNFAGGDNRLCVDKNGEHLGCVRGWSAKISVSDWGGVLYDGGTGKTCGGWECKGIFYWQAGNQIPDLLQAVGSHAQWITPEVATALRAWGSHENAPSGKSRN